METEHQIITNDLRETLKSLMQSELEKLPALLEEMEPKERAAFICKVMPYVFPKVDTVSIREGEPLFIG